MLDFQCLAFALACLFSQSSITNIEGYEENLPNHQEMILQHLKFKQRDRIVVILTKDSFSHFQNQWETPTSHIDT